MPRGAESLGAWWDEAAAQAASEFFSAYIRFTEGEKAGQPFLLEPWQRDRIIRPLFGWKRADGTRLIRTLWLWVPRKNGKTELAAGLALLLLLGDGEFGGQVYSMATNKQQAELVWRKAQQMAAMSPALAKELELYTTSIFCPALSARFMPLSGNLRGKHGLSPTAGIGDEVHEWESWEVADTVHKGMAARAQPVEVYISTAGSADCAAAEWYEMCLEIARGDLVDPATLVVIFTAPEGADWREESTWRAANPNYGVSVKPDFLREECEKAQRSPRAENAFKRYHLNIWTEQVTRWLPMEAWRDACTAEPGDPRLWARLPEAMAGRECWGGLDLGVTSDLSSLCWLFPPPPGEAGRWVYIWRYWLPVEALAKVPSGQALRLRAFADAGALTLTPGNVMDNDLIRAAVVRDAATYNVRWLGIDRFNAVDVATRLREQDGLPVEFFGQGYLSMNAPAKSFERMVIAGELEHGNHPVSAWMAANAAVETDAAGSIKPTKAGGAKGKVDGIVAAVMATGGAIAEARDASPVLFI
jgi:phage terminase large subunit-like protein